MAFTKINVTNLQPDHGVYDPSQQTLKTATSTNTFE